MATNQTTNYQLNQWEPTDAVQRVDFNADNAKVDAALKSLSDQVVQKANQSALNTVISAVNQKADASTVSALSQTVAAKADSSTVTALAQTVAQKADQSQVDALAAKAGTQLIKRITLSTPDEYVNLDLMDIDWNQWAIVTIRVLPVLTAGDGFRIHIHMGNESPQITDYIVPQTVLRLFPFFNGNTRIMGLYFPGNYEGNGLDFDYTYSQLEKIELGAEDYEFKAGSVLEVWGTK